MGNSFKKLSFKCDCGKEHQEFVWSSDLDKLSIKCTCGKRVTKKNLNKPVKKSVPGIRTPTKNRV